MPIARLAVFSFGLASCQHIDDIAEVGSPQMPVATEEPQRINVDEVGPKIVRPGVAAVAVTPLADPRYPSPRAQTVAFEDSPPPTQLETWFAMLSSTERKLVRGYCYERRIDPCLGLVKMKEDGGPPTRVEQIEAALGPRTTNQAFYYCQERDGVRNCMTPLVAAFDDGPVELERSAGTFAFEPGAPVSTDWPTAKTPWIALDRDGDGAITSGAELFGDATAVPGGKASNGFAALAALDANGDGVIDARDPMFAQLVLWTDRDGDRRSSAGELRKLAEVIDAIPLAHDVVPRCARGNCEGERGAMTWRDHDGQRRTGAVIDLYLRRR